MWTERYAKKLSTEYKAFGLTDLPVLLRENIQSLIITNSVARGSKEKQRERLESLRGLGCYWREYCSVRMDFGRQTGKTTWIAEEATDKDLVIVANLNFKERFLEMCQIDPCRVMTFRDIRDIQLSPSDVEPIALFERCFIDGQLFLERDVLISVTARLARNYPRESGLNNTFFLL